MVGKFKASDGDKRKRLAVAGRGKAVAGDGAGEHDAVQAAIVKVGLSLISVAFEIIRRQNTLGSTDWRVTRGYLNQRKVETGMRTAHLLEW